MKCIEDEIPFELPEGWEWMRLQSFVNFIGGSQPPKSTFEYIATKDNIRLIQIRDYKTDKFLTFIPRSKARRFCSKDDVMIGRYGPPIFQILRGLEGSYNVALMKAVADPDIMLNDYLYYLLQDGELLKMLESLSDRTCGQDGINMYELNRYIIGIPPLEEQERIIHRLVAVLPIVDEITNNKEKLTSLIDKTKAKILDLAIRGKLVPQDLNDEPATVLLERIRTEKEKLIKQGKIKRDKKESIIFKGGDNSYYEKIDEKVVNIKDEIPFAIPDTWEFLRLKEVWELISGRDLTPTEYNSEKQGIPFITGASNFMDGRVELVRWTTSPQVKTELGDLLLTCKGTIGEMAFNDFGSAHIARQIMAIRNVYGLNSEYFSLCMEFYINAIKNVAKGLIPGISRKDILNLILPLPPQNYQERVVKRVKTLTDVLTAIEKSLN